MREHHLLALHIESFIYMDPLTIQSVVGLDRAIRASPPLLL